MSGQGVVRAAGCVLWRRARSPLAHREPGESWAGHGGIELCLVHRPKYGDWSHPKGKLKTGEPPLAAALREVAEETGFRCTPGPVLPSAHYLAHGRPKQVSYWAAEAGEGGFRPSREVDRICWLPPLSARARLTEPRDKELVDALLTALRLG
ncbi:NUDIX hydrolase [Streptomyces physcomitrii]|uniref:NUDIX hydrolase n=1 Tax=Streptomyces physcomitrii TaxID=2724184 RepID=UPI00343FD3C5